MLAVVGAVLTLTAGLVPVLGVIVQSQLAANAADAAALAAADALTGAVPGTPCALARTVAQRNGARLMSCDGDGLETSVSVAINVLGFEVTPRSRAGPEPGGSSSTTDRAGAGQRSTDRAGGDREVGLSRTRSR